MVSTVSAATGNGGRGSARRAGGTGAACVALAALCSGLSPGALAQDGVATDRAALEALYDATNGPAWSDSINWKTAAPLGEWHGVTTDAAGRVRWLELGDNGLSGPLPSPLRNLSNLEYLALSRNALTGPIPSWLGELSNLRALSLWGNRLSGALPSSLRHLSNLEYLLLGRNALTGPVPSWLGDLPSLATLYLSYSDLSGPIPSSLGNLSNLENLWLGHNAVSGPIPSALGRLSNLEELDLGGNELSGPTPLELTELRNLVLFDVSGNEVCVPGDAAFQDWRAAIEARGGEFRASSCESHAGDRETLSALYDAMGGADWTDDTNWKSSEPLYTWHGVTTDGDGRVAVLDLRDNNLAGGIPGAIGSLANLRELRVEARFSGPIPTELGNLAGLESLDLWNDNDYLDPDDQGLTGSIPPEIGNLTSLTELSLGGHADLTGSIPPALGNLVNLERLVLVGNGLTGSIPPELGALTNLLRLIVGHNRLTGTLPAALGGLTELSRLGLGDNDWTAGPIPSWVGNLADLRRLDLSNANLAGPIPDWLGGMPNLRDVDLSYNWGLSGSLPASLNLSHLDSFEVFGTRACAPGAWRPWIGEVDFRGAMCGVEEDRVDVAVFYTGAARAAAGGRAQIEATIDLFVAGTNQALTESGVGARIALVATEEVDYAETGDSSLDLTRLRDESDGWMDDVHAVRDRFAADLVNLIASSFDDAGGRAYVGGAFSVLALKKGTSSFAHELGHNFGLRHDRYQEIKTGGGLSSYPGYGYVNQRVFERGADPGSGWMTIMPYHTQCSDNGVVCPELLRYSNSRQTWGGDPLGVPFSFDSGSGADGPADAAAVFDATAPAVADFRRGSAENRAPTAAAGLPDRSLRMDEALNVDLSPAFADPDGDALTYGASSSAPDVATVFAAGARVTLTAVEAGTATIRVTATDPGGLSASQSFAVTVRSSATGAPFTDDPIVSGVTPVRAVHFMELRARIDALRATAGLARFRWTDPVLTAGATRARLVHLRELRAALTEAYAAVGRVGPEWTDAAPAAGATPIRAAHLMELRAAVRALE